MIEYFTNLNDVLMIILCVQIQYAQLYHRDCSGQLAEVEAFLEEWLADETEEETEEEETEETEEEKLRFPSSPSATAPSRGPPSRRP